MTLIDLTPIRTELSKDGRLRQAGIAEPRLLDAKEAARYLYVSPWVIRRLYHQRLIPAVRIGRLLRFDKRDLDRFIVKEKELK